MAADTRPLVSVVIPSYNHERFVEQAIRSVLDQSYPNLEILITDDGSSDGTVEAVRRISDPRINLEVFSENRGASAAANASIARSRGAFICNLSSDDAFLPGKIERQVAYLLENPSIAAVFGLPKMVDERGDPQRVDGEYYRNQFMFPLTQDLRTRHDWLRHFFFHGNCLCHPTVMLRRAAYDKIGPFDPRLANLPDFDMWVRLCMEHDIHVMREELVAMRILDQGGNMSSPRRESILRTEIECFEVLKHYRHLPREAVFAIFARDIPQIPQASESPQAMILAELALMTHRPAHKLFALDTLFQQRSDSVTANRQLQKFTGSVDLFGWDAFQQVRNLQMQINLSGAEADRLRRELEAAKAEIASLKQAKASTPRSDT